MVGTKEKIFDKDIAPSPISAGLIFGNKSGITSSTPINIKPYHHAGAKINESTIKIYLDSIVSIIRIDPKPPKVKGQSPPMALLKIYIHNQVIVLEFYYCFFHYCLF